MVHQRAKYAQKVKGLRAKLFNKKRFQEKADMKKTCALAVARLFSANRPCSDSAACPTLLQPERAPREECVCPGRVQADRGLHSSVSARPRRG